MTFPPSDPRVAPPAPPFQGAAPDPAHALHGSEHRHHDHGRHGTGVSWGAILAGAAAASALSLVLLILGVGLGLSSISPYSYSSAPLGWGAIAWIAFAQLAAAGIGGYLAGRLRASWPSLHGDEVHFRDTAHGLIAWSVSTLAVAGLLAGGVSAALGKAADVGAAAAPVAMAKAADGASSAQGPRAPSPVAYVAKGLLRSESDEPPPVGRAGEIADILSAGVANGGLGQADRTYLGRIVAARSGASQEDSMARVDQAYVEASKNMEAARMAADQARKQGAYASLWMFVALLLGAFVASLAATWGGRQRDGAREALVARP